MMLQDDDFANDGGADRYILGISAGGYSKALAGQQMYIDR
jgi:hypothetical protein